jgi:hypothetical protein
MNLLFSLYVLVLFFVLTPGILVTLPKNGSKMMVTAVHGAIFAAVLFFTGHSVWRMTEGALEGFKEGKKTRIKSNPGVRIKRNPGVRIKRNPGVN